MKMSIFNSYSHRLTQQQDQELIDNKISKLPCSKVVNELLLYDRELNRKQTRSYDQISFYNIPKLLDNIELHMFTIDSHQKKLLTILAESHSCDELAKYLHSLK